VYPVWYKFSFVGILGAAVLLAGISALVVYRARQNPFLPVGWFWFVGALVPVIGLIQVGAQSRADRYMYIPSIGLSIALIWGIDALFQLACGRRKEVLPPDTSASLRPPQHFWNSMEWCSSRRAQFLVLAAVLVLAACLFCTRRQAGYWHDSETLFRH